MTLRPMEQFEKTLQAARRVSTPLISVRTADPALTVNRLQEAVGRTPAMVQWDIVRGFIPLNDGGAKERGKLVGERDPAGVGPVEALVMACGLAEDAILVYANAQRFWNDPQVVQAIWNLRDVFKASGRTLVLMTTPGAILPDELMQDVFVLDEPLPAADDLSRILEETISAAEVPELEVDGNGKTIALNRLVDGLRSFFCPKRVQFDRASCCSRAGSDARKRGAGTRARVQDACLLTGEHQEAPNSLCLGR